MLHKLEWWLLVLGFVIGVLCFGCGIGWRFEGKWLHLLWVVSPYLVYGMFRFSARPTLPPQFIAGFVCSLVMLALSIFVYGYCLVFSIASTSGLAFLFVPLYLLVGWPVVYALAVGTYRAVTRRRVHVATGNK